MVRRGGRGKGERSNSKRKRRRESSKGMTNKTKRMKRRRRGKKVSKDKERRGKVKEKERTYRLQSPTWTIRIAASHPIPSSASSLVKETDVDPAAYLFIVFGLFSTSRQQKR